MQRARRETADADMRMGVVVDAAHVEATARRRDAAVALMHDEVDRPLARVRRLRRLATESAREADGSHPENRNNHITNGHDAAIGLFGARLRASIRSGMVGRSCVVNSRACQGFETR